MTAEIHWQEKLKVARWAISGGEQPAQPAGQAGLMLAVDCCYFAMYHALCRSNAQALPGRVRKPSPEDWRRVYMGMYEDTIADRFRQHRPWASDAVKDFGACFAIVQDHRDRAMERLFTTFLPSETATLVDRAESAILGLTAIDAEERRSLALALLVGGVRGRGPCRSAI